MADEFNTTDFTVESNDDTTTDKSGSTNSSSSQSSSKNWSSESTNWASDTPSGTTSGTGSTWNSSTDRFPASNDGSSMGMNGSNGASLKDQVKEQGTALLNQTKEVTGQALDTAKNQVKSQLSTQKNRAADGLDSAVRALEGTKEQFRQNDLDFIAGYADNITDQIRQLTGYLHDKDIDDLMRDVESFARRNPAVFIGGAFLLGIAAARFLKSSSKASDGWSTRNPDRDLPVPLSNSRSFMMDDPTSNSMDVYGERPMNAHNYVPGIGVTGNDEEI